MTHPQAPARPDGIPPEVMKMAEEFYVSGPGGSFAKPSEQVLTIARAIMIATAQERERVEAECTAKLSDPNAVHAMMLRGTIAKPSISQIVHLYGTDALYRATGG